MGVVIEKNGVRTEIPESEVSFFLRMGYEKVEDLPVESEEIDEDMTVAELKQQAKDLGLTGYSGMNKAELIALLDDTST